VVSKGVNNMNYRERLREDIKCLQFGDITYGRLGSLKYEDRKSIKRLLDEMDRADEVIKKQFFELNKQKEVLDKIKEYCKEVIEEHNNGEYNVSTTQLAIQEHKDNIENILELLEELK
jgi:hypothetical protein